jgi:hypothetical protein
MLLLFGMHLCDVPVPLVYRTGHHIALGAREKYHHPLGKSF